jgi:hypothetical protein
VANLLDDNPLRLKHRSEHWAAAYFDRNQPEVP